MNKEEIIKALKELRDESFDIFMKAEWGSYEETYHNASSATYRSVLEFIQGELEEPLYYVKLPNTNSMSKCLYLARGNSTGDCWFNTNLELIEYDINTCKHQFTEAEIKSIDSRYWHFAVPVKEDN